MVRNRAGQTTDSVLEPSTRRSSARYCNCRVAPDAVLCTDGSNMLAAVARELHLEHQAMNVQRGQRVRGAWHIQNVNAYHGRFKKWIALQRSGHVVPAQLPGLVPSARPQCPVR